MARRKKKKRKGRVKHLNQYLYEKFGGGRMHYVRCLTCYGKKRRRRKKKG